MLRFSDTANLFSFSAVGFTTPTFWDGAAFYVIALSQRASDVRVWTLTPYSLNKPVSTGNLADSSLFVKFAKPFILEGLIKSFDIREWGDQLLE